MNQVLFRIVKGAMMLLDVCDGAIMRDEKGYDIYDAGHFRGFLLYPDIFGVEGLSPEEIEWMRRKLLRYKSQLANIGFEIDCLERKVHPVAFFSHAQDWEGQWLRVSPHSLQKIPIISFHSLKIEGSDLDLIRGRSLVEWIKSVEKSNGWIRLRATFIRDAPLKKLWIRFNDPDENGKTRKWWIP
mgnify:CR=1 FL=1